MERYKVKDLKYILEKWINISKDFNNEKYKLMGEVILDNFKKYNSKDYIEDILKLEGIVESKHKSKTVQDYKEKILEYLLALDSNDKEKLKSYNFKIILDKDNLINIWENASDKEKLSATKIELNVIYNYLYSKGSVKYINKSKKIIIKDIDEFVYTKLRNSRIDSL
ncbi:hypothetical protein ACQPUY_09490 [Clostridium nigeriense]|uniref:hypothetical protein n=1 Tax=Clostridium nigeriense TaxID=1805470 RepID=UPI003D32F6AF